ncbi:MAG: SCO family protein [Syntrophobacteraceae bacterium]
MKGNRRKRLRTVTFFLILISTVALFRGSPAIAAGSASSIWGADYFPNIPLITHTGEKVRFFDDLIKDKVVAINFIFTRCPDACPLETARLREVQKILGDRVGKDVFMYSITIDPEYDTQEVMKEYAEKFEAGPGWLFLTGNKDDIVLLRKKLGLYNVEEEGGNLTAHTLSLIIGNQKTGHWRKGSPFENPYVLATQIGSWLHNWKMPPKKKRDYSEAPELRSISKGESLFRTRCAACHTIGDKDEVRMGKKPIGPDLLGVTEKRDRTWLIRIIAEPDKLFEEQDPLALALLAEYGNLKMPNMRLNEIETMSLITYLEEESARLEQVKASDQQPRDQKLGGKHTSHKEHK